jgi:AcrR family transcriptional regulator
MIPMKSRALDAAVELVGSAGVRALTHARIDERAGLPRGSTSNYFRTRAALLSGVVDWIVEREMVPVGQAATPATPATLDELMEWMSGLIEFTTGPNRTMTTARLALFLEASHDDSLREALARGRASMEAATVVALARLGVPDSSTAAAALMACAEGLILHRIARGDDSDPRPILTRVLRGVLLPGTDAAPGHTAPETAAHP